MKNGADRRIHHRWDSNDTIYGYVDGARFAASTENLSSGGMFLETRDPVPVGALVSLVFRDQAKSTNPPIFLIGRVMRRQKRPTLGVGLRWEKAVFTGASAILHRFLLDRLRVQNPAVVSVTGSKGEVKAIHHFNSLPVAAAVASSKAVPSSANRGSGTVPDSGPVTTRINRQGTMAPANIRALLSLDDKQEPIIVHALGLKSMFTGWPPSIDIGPDLEVNVTLSVRTRTGMANVECACIVTIANEGEEDSDSTLDLDIVDVQEPKGHGGLLSRYVRWLHFNSLTNS